MAIHINPTKIDPKVGNSFEAVYKARMAQEQPWIDQRNKNLKDISEVAKLALAAYLNGTGGEPDAGDSADYFSVDKGEVDETDMDLFNGGLDPKLFNAMNRYNKATANYRSMFDDTTFGDI